MRCIVQHKNINEYLFCIFGYVLTNDCDYSTIYKPTWVEFRFSKEHHKFLKDFMNEYGNNRMGRSKFVKYVTINDLWRNPFSQNSEAFSGSNHASKDDVQPIFQYE